MQGQGVVTVTTGQRFLPGKTNLPETSVSEPTMFSVSQLPELEGSKGLIRERPAGVPCAGPHHRSAERGTRLHKGLQPRIHTQEGLGQAEGGGGAGPGPCQPLPPWVCDPQGPQHCFLSFQLMGFFQNSTLIFRSRSRLTCGSCGTLGVRGWGSGSRSGVLDTAGTGPPKGHRPAPAAVAGAAWGWPHAPVPAGAPGNPLGPLTCRPQPSPSAHLHSRSGTRPPASLGSLAPGFGWRPHQLLAKILQSRQRSRSPVQGSRAHTTWAGAGSGSGSRPTPPGQV